MVNTQLFKTQRGPQLPPADARNQAQAPAYALSPRHQLAQLAATGCLSQTFYAGADIQLDRVTSLAMQVDLPFLAKTAIYARESGHMKDMPALLAVVLAERDVELLARVFGRVIDNGRMLRSFVQILRSGAVGRKSLGSRPKKLVQQWLLSATERQLLNASVGNSPSLADVVKMVHPKPAEDWRAAWFAWLLGKPFDLAALPPLTQAYERFKQTCATASSVQLPDVPFQMLTSLPLRPAHWAEMARNGSWQMLRQGLNAFARHGVFERRQMVKSVAAKLRDPESVAKSRVLPYQLLAAFKATGETVPAPVRESLEAAMELAIRQVPVFKGRVVVCPDVSGSMSSPVTGERAGATTAVRCIDVAALMAVSVLRKNPGARVLPFEQRVVSLALNPADSLMKQAALLADIGGGGTNCSAPLALLNEEQAEVDVVLIVSDNESWIDANRYGATQTLREWERLKQRNPRARLVCIDIQPYATTQAPERADVMNIGGFSDEIFGCIARFVENGAGGCSWVDVIERVPLLPA